MRCTVCGEAATHYAISGGGRVRNEKPLCDGHAKTYPTGNMPIDLWHETMLQDFSTIFETQSSKPR